MLSSRLRIFLCAAAASGALAAPSAHAQDILIGQVSSHTSPRVAANAKALHAGITVYFDHINAQGGVGGRKVRLVNKDDQFVPAKMTELTKEFVPTGTSSPSRATRTPPASTRCRSRILRARRASP
jgi:hypothetical protein